MLVLVSGASRGIGFEIVKKLAETPAISVITASRTTDSLEKFAKKNPENNIFVLQSDITNARGRQKIVKAVQKSGKGLDVLINNAGMLVNKAFHRISEKELNEVYATNVFAPFQLIQDMLPHFSTVSKSHIVNISSMGGFQGSAKFSGLSAYSSSKAAIASLSECLAEELKLKKISVNCLAIGAVQTEMLAKAFPGYKAPVSAEQMAEYICNFALNGQKYFNGKIIPVSLSTP